MASSNIKMSFEKSLVITTLQQNRAEHETIYKESVEGYREAFAVAVKKTQSLLADKMAELEDEKLPQPYLKRIPLSDLTTPKNCLNEYDTVLEMLELTPDDTIILDQDQYNCYMKDNWHWMSEFLLSNAKYSVGASAKLGRM